MKRNDVLKQIRKAAKRQGVHVETFSMTNHDGLVCGEARTTIPRHTEIPDRMAETIFKQLEPALGSRWWK